MEKTACLSFVAFLKTFLEIKKKENSADLVVRMLKVFFDLGCEMSIKLHFISSYFDQETSQDDCLNESGSTKILRKWMIITESFFPIEYL